MAARDRGVSALADRERPDPSEVVLPCRPPSIRTFVLWARHVADSSRWCRGYARNVDGAALWPMRSGGASHVDIDKDKRRNEVEHFLRKHMGLDREALDFLLKVFILLSYPTREGQDN